MSHCHLLFGKSGSPQHYQSVKNQPQIKNHRSTQFQETRPTEILFQLYKPNLKALIIHCNTSLKFLKISESKPKSCSVS